MISWIRAAFLYAEGDSHLQIGHYKEAESYFRKAVKLDPQNAHATAGLGYSLFKQGRLDEAEPYLQKAPHLAAYELKPNLYLVDFLVETGRKHEAEEPLKAILINETNAGFDHHEFALDLLNEIRKEKGKKPCDGPWSCLKAA